jgi:TetR/AcrR family transcriptional repressor of nem operon
MADMRETILNAAQPAVQAHGYGGLSFRELGKEIGIKSASIHYHFPTKGDLGAALARRYWEEAQAALNAFSDTNADPAACLRFYTAVFRVALENGNRMCLCGFLAAEIDGLPEVVRAEVKTFVDVCVRWLATILPGGDRALAVYAAISGAQLAARSRGDVTVFDRIVESYRAAGLIPA